MPALDADVSPDTYTAAFATASDVTLAFDKPSATETLSTSGKPSASGGPSTSEEPSTSGRLSGYAMQVGDLQQSTERTPAAVMRPVICGMCFSTTMTLDHFVCICKSCGRFICAVGNCGTAYIRLSGLNTHQRKHDDPMRCYGCNALKPPRGTLESQKCPNCGSIWCLKCDCGYQTSTTEKLKDHQKHKH